MPLDWLPDETLFGLASRYHVIAGNRLPEQTCMQLFGHRRQGAAHDFPARVDEFVRRTNGMFGNAEDAILDHTLLPFYLPFASDSAARSAVEGLRSGSLSGVKAQLGILASGFGASHPLKACVNCMVEDIRVHKVAFWRLEHQWPGCWVCHKHGELLRYGLGKVNAAARFQWLLPEDLEFTDPVDCRSRAAAMPILCQLAECARGLGRLPRWFHFEAKGVVAAYKARLVELQVANASGRLKMTEFEEVLSRVCVPLSSVYGLTILSGDVSSLSRQFGRLAHDSRPRAHPLRHLILITALFSSWDAFLSEYERRIQREILDECLGASRRPVVGAPSDGLRHLVIQAVDDGLPVTAAASGAGVSVGTAMAWLGSSGRQVRRRPKKLRQEIRNRAVAALKKGATKKDVAKLAVVSIQTVTRLLCTEPGLRNAWSHAILEHRRLQARAAWRRTTHKLRAPTVKTVRASIAAEFAWLRRNDRLWLEEACRSLTQSLRNHVAGVDWPRRDRELANEVERAAAAMRKQRTAPQPKLSDLCNLIPRLKPMLSKLKKLPQTQEALRAARSTLPRA